MLTNKRYSNGQVGRHPTENEVRESDSYRFYNGLPWHPKEYYEKNSMGYMMWETEVSAHIEELKRK